MNKKKGKGSNILNLLLIVLLVPLGLSVFQVFKEDERGSSDSTSESTPAPTVEEIDLDVEHICF